MSFYRQRSFQPVYTGSQDFLATDSLAEKRYSIPSALAIAKEYTALGKTFHRETCDIPDGLRHRPPITTGIFCTRDIP